MRALPALPSRPRSAPAGALLVPWLAAWVMACGGASSAPPAATPPTTPTSPTTPSAPVIPAIGDASVIDMATWNLEWFGDPSNGPSNETQQAANIRAALAGADVDLWAVQEVVSATAFRSLVGALPGYAGVLANDPVVTGGAASYSDFNDAEQKVGLIYKSGVAAVIGARVILTERDFDFAGRPPVEFRVRITVGGVVDTIPVIVLHAKAGSDAASYARRATAASSLKAWVEQTYPTQAVWVIGDFNDDMDVSITAGQPSPYAAIVSDTLRWRVPTKALSDARQSTTVSFPDAIDHHVVTRSAGLRYVPLSARVWRLDSLIPNYRTTTTDHYPVVARYRTR